MSVNEEMQNNSSDDEAEASFTKEEYFDRLGLLIILEDSYSLLIFYIFLFNHSI